MEIVKNTVKNNIIRLVFDEYYAEKSINIPMIAIDEFNKIVEELGLKNIEQSETNGWQHDFWQYYEYKDKQYVLAGSWYYGNYIFSEL